MTTPAKAQRYDRTGCSNLDCMCGGEMVPAEDGYYIEASDYDALSRAYLALSHGIEGLIPEGWKLEWVVPHELDRHYRPLSYRCEIRALPGTSCAIDNIISTGPTPEAAVKDAAGKIK